MKRWRSGTARRVEVADPVPGGGVLAAPDYASGFEVPVADSGGCSPEQWARSIFEGAPRPLRWFVVVGWTTVLRLQLGPRPSPGYVLGWRIVTTTAQTITLEARSTLVTAHKVLHVYEGRLAVATLVRYERRLGRVVWSAIAPIHHRIEPLLLSVAVRTASPTSGDPARG